MLDEQVIISMRRYNELLEKEEVINGTKIRILEIARDDHGMVCKYEYRHIESSEINPFLEDIMNSIMEDNDRLNKEVDDLKNISFEFKTPEVDNQYMSYWDMFKGLFGK